MKYEVIQVFKDKYSGEIYEVGKILELTKKRANEILMVDALIKEYIEPEKENEEVKEPEKENEEK